MRRTRKKRYGILLAFMLFMMAVGRHSTVTKAEDVSVVIALSASNVNVGDTVTVMITVSGGSLSAYTMYVSYSSGLLQYNSGSGAVCGGGGGTVTVSGTGPGTVTLSFTAIAEGSASVSTSGAEYYDINAETLSVAHAGVVIGISSGGGTVTTEQPVTTEAPASTEQPTTEDGKSDNSNLVSLAVSPGTLEPAFAYNVTSYYIQLEKGVTSLNVTAETEDSKAKVRVDGADGLVQGVNIVSVVVTAENGSTKTYRLRVVVGQLLENAQIEVNGSFYRVVNDEEKVTPPDDFFKTTVQYQDWEILAYQSPNMRITVVCLEEIAGEDEAATDTSSDTADGEDRDDEETASDDRRKWFIYDAEKELFLPYEEFQSVNNRFVILELPEGVSLPDGYYAESLTIRGKEVPAYRSEYMADADIYLVYAVNIKGAEGFYLFDRVENVFMRYVPETVSKQEEATAQDAAQQEPKPVVTKKKDEGFFTKQMLLVLLLGSLCLLVTFVVLSIVQIAKKRQLKEELDLAESMVEQLVAAKGANKVGGIKTENTEEGENSKPEKDAESEDLKTEKNEEPESPKPEEAEEPENSKPEKAEEPENSKPEEAEDSKESKPEITEESESPKPEKTEEPESSKPEETAPQELSRKEEKTRKKQDEKAERKARRQAKKEAEHGEDMAENILNTMAGIPEDEEDVEEFQVDSIPEISLGDYGRVFDDSDDTKN